MKPSHAGIMLLLAKKHGAPPPDADDGDAHDGDEDGPESTEDAARDVLTAIDGKDAAGLAKALSDFIELDKKNAGEEGPSAGE